MQQRTLSGEPVNADAEREQARQGALRERFGLPPFSTLDARKGYWQKRKRRWYKAMGFEGQGLAQGLLDGGNDSGIVNKINKGRSLFDPVLAEALLRWFCVDGGMVLDPFAGEAVKGVLSELLGYDYVGVELRGKQVDANQAIARDNDVIPLYIHGDSTNLQELTGEYAPYDFCFTSPPYYNLEVYSDDDMSGVSSYDEFKSMYSTVFEQVYNLLGDDTFMALKVSEIRDEKGAYRGFVADNVHIMQELGFKLYNDAVLINPVGTGAMRANRYFRNKKLVRLHQNVLVFYKGDLSHIGDKYGGDY